MKFSGSVLLLLSLFSKAQGSVTQLTAENFESLSEGKSVFIKFFAPWCGHCRSMADDWEKLAEDWEGHPIGLVAEVDCTSDEGKPLCEDFEVEGFPTLVYGDPLGVETYEGARDYASFSAFAKENIATLSCSVFKQTNCSDEQKKIIEAINAKSDEELMAIAGDVDDLVKLQEEMFDSEVEKIQMTYDAVVEDFNLQLETIKAKFNYNFLEQIINVRELAAGDPEEGEEHEL